MTQMDNFNISELGIFIGVCGSAIIGILVATQKSKCESVCFGMCKRRVDLVIEEEKLELGIDKENKDNDNKEPESEEILNEN